VKSEAYLVKHEMRYETAFADVGPGTPGEGKNYGEEETE
jgi:hypothetical protein